MNDLVLARLGGSGAPAVRTSEGDWTGDELLARAGGAAAWLDRVGAEPGAPVPALLSSSPGALALALAGALTARPLAPLGPRMTAAEVAPAVAALGARVLVADPGAAPLGGAVAALTGVRLEVLDTAPPPVPVRPVPAGPDDVGAILHTSGTTGRPKAVPLRQAPLARRPRIYAELLGLGPGDLWYTASPYHHVAGLGMHLVALGAGAAVLPLPAFSIEAWTAAAPLSPTHALLVPTMIDALLTAGSLAAVPARVLMYGGAPIHVVTLGEMLAALPSAEVVQTFGQTEGSPLTCLMGEDHRAALRGRPELLGSVGRPVPGLELRIDHPDAEGVGEVVVRADHLFLPGPDGWMRTGDLGVLDGDGFLFLRGRLGDKIIRGGENVYPAEVEAVLGSHPGVREAAVVGVPDRRWGEVVKAVIVAADPADPPPLDELRAHARRRLAGFKVPTLWQFADDLPRTPSGKVLRRALAGGP